jgi:hypothetical protein
MVNVPAAALRTLGVALVAVAMLGVFGTAPASSSPSMLCALKDVTVTGDPELPAGCNSPHDTAMLVSNFLDAFNRGDNRHLGRFFGPDFMWYSITKPERNFVAYSTGELLKYFEARHTQHERLQLASIDVRGPGWHGGVDLVYTLTRQADDLGSQRQALRGKGAVNCKDRSIFVWSMGSGT